MITINGLRTAIIGCGNIHNVHAEGIKRSEAGKLVCVVDIDEDRAKASAATFDCNYMTDYRDMLQDNSIDVVHICTPHYLHAEMAIEAMKAGKHVLVEKPMAINADDAEEMIRVSEQTGKKLCVCFQNRYNLTSEKIIELLNSGRTGKIKGARAIVTWNRGKAYYDSGDWRGTWSEEGGGVLINQAIHTLDLLQLALGQAVSIKGSYSTRLLEDVIEVEDTADAAIKFSSGATALFYATNCHVADSPILLEIICENAVLRLENELEVKYSDGKTEVFSEQDRATGEKAYWGTGHATIIKDFYKSILDGTAVRVDGRQGITAIKLIEGLYKSAKEGRFIDIT